MFDVVLSAITVALFALCVYRRVQVDRLEARIRAARIELGDAMDRDGTESGRNCVLRAYAALDSDRTSAFINRAFPEKKP